MALLHTHLTAERKLLKTNPLLSVAINVLKLMLKTFLTQVNYYLPSKKIINYIITIILLNYYSKKLLETFTTR